jgi:peroxiredoxin
MSNKLGIGAVFPRIAFHLAGGGSLEFPDGLDAKYRVALFYRGHWWPFCRRQLVGFETLKSELEEFGVKVVAASVDPIDKAREVASEVSFPIGYGVTREIANVLGSWWEDRRAIIQPSEFLIGADGKILASSYSDGPIGRFEAGDVIRLIKFREAQLKKP